MLVDYAREYHCNDGKLLKLYLQMAVQLIMIEAVAMTISSKGTIANPHPCQNLKWVLYIQAILFIVELVWNPVGMQWVFDPIIEKSPKPTITFAIQSLNSYCGFM